MLSHKLGLSSYVEALKKLKKNDFFQYLLTGLFQMAFDFRLFKVQHWIREQTINHHLIE